VGLGLDVQLRLVDLVGRLELALQGHVVPRHFLVNHRDVLDQVLEAGELGDIVLVGLGQVGAGDLVELVLGVLELGAGRAGGLGLGDGVVEGLDQPSDLVVDLLLLGLDLGLDRLELLGPGADLLAQLVILLRASLAAFWAVRVFSCSASFWASAWAYDE